MFSKKTLIAVSFTALFSASSLFSQINLLSNEINFRTSSSKDKVTLHYGNMNVLGFGQATNESILYAKYESASAQDKVAVSGYSCPTPYYGIGGSYWGGWKGIECYALLTGTGSRYGGSFRAYGGELYNYGVWTIANSTQGSNYGIYAQAYGSTTNYAGYFSGNVHITGTLTNPSDIKFKKDMSPVTGSLKKILKLQPKHYFYKTDEFESMHFSKAKKVGLVAQELETIFPELVTEEVMPISDTDADGKKIDIEELEAKKKENTYKSIDYISLIPILINAIQEQQEEINHLKGLLKY